MNSVPQRFQWQVADQTLQRTTQPLLMGILNVTPDSFSDGGQYTTIETAVAQGLQLAEDGADLIDIGGESTRPGAEPVSADEELQRVVPVITELSRLCSVPISIDTTKAAVASAAMDCGAAVINDVSGMTFDPDMIDIAVKHDASVCLMHIKGTPQTMQADPHYDDVVAEVILFLRQRMDACLQAGLSPHRICLDPGIGFGKTAEHNLMLMRALPRMSQELNRPLLIGHSRKRFLSKILGRKVEERLAGTLGVSIALASLGADILRVHDVRATRDALIAWNTVASGGVE